VIGSGAIDAGSLGRGDESQPGIRDGYADIPFSEKVPKPSPTIFHELMVAFSLSRTTYKGSDCPPSPISNSFVPLKISIFTIPRYEIQEMLASP